MGRCRRRGLVLGHGGDGDVGEGSDYFKLVVVGRVDLVSCFRLGRSVWNTVR